MFLAPPFQALGTLKLAAEGWVVEAPLFGRVWVFPLIVAPLPESDRIAPLCEWPGIGYEDTRVAIQGNAVWGALGVIGRIDQTRRNESRPL